MRNGTTAREMQSFACQSDCVLAVVGAIPGLIVAQAALFWGAQKEPFLFFSGRAREGPVQHLRC
jgi:hypothetical protein